MWLQALSGGLGFLILAATFWRTVLRPMVRFAGTAERAAPALERIAADFPVVDGHSTLTTKLAEIAESSGRCEDLMRKHVDQHVADLHGG